MGDTGAWQHTEIGPLGGGGWVEGSTEPGTDPQERLEREAWIDQVYSETATQMSGESSVAAVC